MSKDMLLTTVDVMVILNYSDEFRTEMSFDSGLKAVLFHFKT